MSAATWAIETAGLTKSFGGHRVLRGIDIKVAMGESVVIFGPNGAGKTTLVKILATVMNPTSGAFRVNGLSAADNAEAIRRSIGVITHQTFLYSAITSGGVSETLKERWSRRIITCRIDADCPEGFVCRGGRCVPVS
jgi:Cys-rich repeat protein